jgi:uncharacterized protein (TIGR03083 family)
VTSHLEALRSSTDRLRALIEPLSDGQLELSAYPAEWTIADVLSHLGSGAIITRRRLDDALAEQAMPDDFAPAVWDEWNAKSPRAQADDALAADHSLIERLESLTADEQASFHVAMGPMTFDLSGFVALRLNEHAMHSWDIAVSLDPAAVIPADATALIVDSLELIARYTASPTGTTRTMTIHTTVPDRVFEIDLGADTVTFTPAGGQGPADLTTSAEALTRLVYGRLDPMHTPAVLGDETLLEELRRVFPGP